ncbi:hypothetical protein FKO01_25405 [Mesorhizobium sp. B2-3-3]|nr:hypothetical protein FKO01_25405 [Mesorhizobium sp. B2-3-3]
MKTLLLAAPFAMMPLVAPAAGQVTSGGCSPIVQGVGGNVTINCVAATTPSQKGTVANQNVQFVIDRFHSMLYSNAIFVLPAVDAYLKHPSKARWKVIAEGAQLNHQILEVALKSVFDAEPYLPDSLKPHFDALAQFGMTKSALLFDLPSPDEPMDADQLLSWEDDYRDTVRGIVKELAALDSDLKALAEHRT